MSALARYFKFKGYAVSGYDKTPSDLTAQLMAEGIGVHYDDRPDLVPADVKETLVIWTPAIHELKELDFVRENGYRVVMRSLALGEVAKGQRCLAVSGTHGKTTTSTMIAHIFTESGEGCSAFLGGISRNYGTNLLVSDNDVVVAEADEFDRSFHQLFPEIAVITAIDADHLDIYGDYAHVLEAFQVFASQVSGTVIAKKGVPITPADTEAQLLTYHYTDPEADFYAMDPHPDACGNFLYDLRWPGGVLQGIRVGAPGRVNAENSIAAAAVALTYGLDPEAVKHAIGTFEGVKRRLEVHVNKPGAAYVDDYAHHPAELAAAIASLRDIFPGRKLTAIFQPHLYTRTRDFAPEFAAALSAVDKLILLPIYPAREEPIPGVTSDIILRGIRVGAPGRVNAENSIAAAAIALTYGLDPEAVKHAIGTFEGVKRRLEVHVNKPGAAYVDDYAHHPAELAAAIASLRDIFPGRKLTGIFQPHLYTRTRDFAPEFAAALSAVDKLILLPIYPAREEPIPGVTSDIILRDVTAPEKVLVEKEYLMEYLEKEPVDVLVTFGAGNIDRFIGPITELVKNR